jgi:DNA-binding NarL/FixJ family response regulator
MRIRVLLANMPPMLRDIIEDAVLNEPDVEIVGTLESHELLLPALAHVDTDVLILTRGPAYEPAMAEELWARWPRIKVLEIAQGGRSAVLHALHPHRVALGDVSPQGLVAAIRGAPAW